MGSFKGLRAFLLLGADFYLSRKPLSLEWGLMAESTTHTDGQTPDQSKNGERQIKIKCGELFKIKTPDGDISNYGICELQDFLGAKGCVLPADFEPTWCTRLGTLPKRVQRHLFKSRGIKLSSEDLSEIGNIAKRNASDGKTFVLDFTQTIDWQDGDFGDSGSCFWGDRGGAKLMLENNGAYAIRGWRYRSGHMDEALRYSIMRGYCRAWVAPIGENLFCVFNGYGETTLTLARLLALKFDCGYQQITLLNNGSDAGELWINGGKAYAIGAWEKIHRLEKHDLGWTEEEGEEEEREYCHGCEVRINDDTLISAYDRDGDINHYCDECAVLCDGCDSYFDGSLVRYFSDTEQKLCRSCLNDAREAQAEREESEVVA